MSSLNLESLSDAELRQKCLDQGLPNVPITDTTRKLIIRRLENALSNKGSDKSKNRRETIHVTNVESSKNTETSRAATVTPRQTPSKHSRRTIAASNITSTMRDPLPESTSVNAIPSRRRSNQPKQQAPSAPANRSPVYEEEYGDDDDDEDDYDDDDVILLEAAERSERDTAEFIIPRTRRSVSLTKTGVVTTSYIQETHKEPPEIVKEVNYEHDEGEDEVEEEEIPRPSYAPVINPTLHFSSAQTSKSSYEPMRSSTIYTTYDKAATIDNRASLPSYGFTSKPYETSSPSVTSFPTRRVTSVVKEEEAVEAPYLSNFTRKLESIKAEQLRSSKVAESPRYTPIPRRDMLPNKPIISGRRSFSHNKTVADSFKDLLRALDQKYNLKRNFIILLVVVLFIFIYIVFIQ